MKKSYHTLRLILGDQLNSSHSWFNAQDEDVLYVLMEVRSETDYAWHHIQKVAAFFASMENFAEDLKKSGHQVLYIKLDDNENQQSFPDNCKNIIKKFSIQKFEYQLPDEYRVEDLLTNFCKSLNIKSSVCDTGHFYTQRNDLADFYEGKKSVIMENFYRHMRKKHDILMEKGGPEGNQWNFDEDNRKKLPKNHKPTPPLIFENDVAPQLKRIRAAGFKTIGEIDAKNFVWPVNRNQSLQLLDYFISNLLPLFGTFQDAMNTDEWSLYHSRLSFCMNSKMVSPKEVIDAAVNAYNDGRRNISINQAEGFVRQILGWREYMRGIYWMKMPEFATKNFFNHKNKLPGWYWTGKTKMNCLKHSIGQSLTHAYAHHIQRLMITGNFALLAGTDPDETDKWYLGIYIDAIEWAEITNTRGMSQFADGGIVGTKPYTGSANYINKMSNYCDSCYYNKSVKTGDKACPFNSLYWDFHDRHRKKLEKIPRLGMVYRSWDRMDNDKKEATLKQAHKYLKNIEEL